MFHYLYNLNHHRLIYLILLLLHFHRYRLNLINNHRYYIRIQTLYFRSLIKPMIILVAPLLHPHLHNAPPKLHSFSVANLTVAPTDPCLCLIHMKRAQNAFVCRKLQHCSYLLKKRYKRIILASRARILLNDEGAISKKS